MGSLALQNGDQMHVHLFGFPRVVISHSFKLSVQRNVRRGCIMLRRLHHDGAGPYVPAPSSSPSGVCYHQLRLELRTCGFPVTSSLLYVW
jgi:hypothetical protein